MSFFIPISAGFENDLNDISKRSTRQLRVKLNVSGLSLEDVTAYLDFRAGVNITGMETDTTGQATPNRATLNFKLESEWILTSGNYKISYGDLRDREVIIEATVGSGNEWITLFTGRTNNLGMTITSINITSIQGNIVATTEEVYAGMRNFPEPTNLINFKISSDSDPDNSIIHFFTRIMGFDDSKVIAGEVPNVKDFVQITGDKTAFQEIKELSQAWLATFNIRNDGYVTWNSKHDINYIAPTSEYEFNEKNMIRQLNGNGAAPLYNKVTLPFEIFEVLNAGKIIHQSVVNRDETTNQLVIQIEAGKYWPDPDNPTAVAQLSYFNPETGVPYPLAINIITPTIGITGGNQDILSTDGLPKIISFNNDTIYLQFNDDAYVPPVPSDIGKTVSGNTSGYTGILVHYDNSKYVWYVKTTDKWELTEGITILLGTGAGIGGPGIGITRENEGSSEILLYNPNVVTITITKLQLRGQPVRSLGTQISQTASFGILPKDESVLNLIGGQYMTNLVTADITTRWWWQARSANRGILTFKTPWMPQAQIEAVITALFPQYDLDIEATIRSCIHEMRGPPASWETSITVVEYDTASRTYAFWKLETIESGDQLIDELGVYDATLLNPSQSTIAIGAFGNGLYLNATGNNSGAEMVSDTELRSFGQKITISVWIKSKSQSSLSDARALSRDYSDHFAILINQSQVTNQDWTIGNSTNNITKSLVAETPHSIIISIDYSKNQMYIWVDGVREALLDWDGTDSSRPLVIGCNTEETIQLGSGFFKGVVDELKIYRGIGTDSEARATYDSFYNKSTENQVPSRGEIFTSSVSSPTLTISINKTLNGSSASGEASIYGFDNYGNPDPVNTDGFIYVDGQKINIPRHYFSPFVTLVTGNTGKGYILFRYRNGFVFSYLGVDYECAFVKFENGQWYYDNNVTWQTLSQAIIDDSVIIGTMECDTPDHIKTAQIWMSPQDVAIVQLQDWKGVIGEGLPSDYADVTGDQTVAGLLPNWNLDINDSFLKPAGIRGVINIANRDQVEFGDSNENTMKILGTPDTAVGYGFPAIPIDDRATYSVTIRHRSENPPSSIGYYLALQEKNSALAPGKTHIGESSGTEDVTDQRTSIKYLLLNGPTPGQTYVIDNYEYIPTIGTKYATFSIYNWLGITGWVEIDYVQIAIQASAERDATVGAPVTTSTTEPPNPVVGQIWINPASGRNNRRWDGTSWVYISLQSSDYIPGSAGWFIDETGNVEFNTGIFRGALSAASGTFSGNLSSAGVITFTTLQNVAGLIRLESTTAAIITANQTDAWNETTGPGSGYQKIDSIFHKWGYNNSGTWVNTQLMINIWNTRKGLQLDGDLVPELDNTYDLGSKTTINRRWRHGYFLGDLETNGLTIGANGNIKREEKRGFLLVAAQTAVLVATFIGSTNRVIGKVTLLDNSNTIVRVPRGFDQTSGTNRVFYVRNADSSNWNLYWEASQQG